MAWPKRVVDDLEVVEVEEQDRDGTQIARVEVDGVFEPVAEQGAIGQAGQSVVEGLVAQLRLLLGQGGGQSLVLPHRQVLPADEHEDQRRGHEQLLEGERLPRQLGDDRDVTATRVGR